MLYEIALLSTVAIRYKKMEHVVNHVKVIELYLRINSNGVLATAGS